MPALPLLEIQEETFQINTDNVNSVLDKALDLPIVVVSINGKSREGKSFLLKYFIRYLKNEGRPAWFEDDLQNDQMFPWRSGPHRVTLGINIWSEPFIYNLNGKWVAVLLLDCQGLFDEYTTQQQNSAIFSLSCLLSSVLLCNVKNKVDEELLQKIDLFSDYTKALVSQLSPEREDARPLFLFLVRDFEIITEFDFGFHTRDEQPEPSRDGCGNYYSRVFTTSSSMSDESRLVRQNFENCFRVVRMFLMSYPGTNFIADLDNQPKLKFLELLEQLVLETVGNFVTKRLGQEEVTGAVFKSYIQMWADLCQNGSFPESSTVKELTAKLQNERALHMAFEGFKSQIRIFMSSIFAGADDDSFGGMFTSFYEEALEIYNANRSLVDEDSVNAYIAQLERTCRGHFEEFSVRENQWVRKEREWEDKKGRLINAAYGVSAGAATIAVAAKVVADVEAAKTGSRIVAGLVTEAVSQSATWASVTTGAASSNLACQTAEVLSAAALGATAETFSATVVGATTEAVTAAVIDSAIEATSATVDSTTSLVSTAIAAESVGLATSACKSLPAALGGSSILKTKIAVAALSSAALVAGPAVLAGPAVEVGATAALGVVTAVGLASLSGIKAVFSKLM